MAGNWNPNAPNVIGNEIRGVYAYLDKATKSPFKAMKLRSNVAETITGVELGIGPTIDTSSPLFKVLDVYNATDIVQGDSAAVFSAAPDAHGTGTGIGNWRTQAGGSTTIHTSIDEAVQYPPIGSDFIRNNGAISNAFFHMNTGAFPLTARVGRVFIRGVVGTDGAFRDVYFRLWHVPSSTLFIPPGDRVRTHYYGLLHSVDLGDINPVSLLPWTPNDIRGFEAANNVWQVRITGAGTAANMLKVHNLELRVQHSTERRVAVGTWQRPPGAAAGVGLSGAPGKTKHIVLNALVRPVSGDWVANWSKPSSGDFVFVFRNALDRLVGGSAPRAQDVHWHFLGGNDRDGRVASPVPGQFAGDVVFGSASTQVHGDVYSAGPFDQPLAGTIALKRSDGVTSDDSQPYVVRYENNVLAPAPASDTHDVCQKFRAPATDSYGGLRFQVKPPADGSLQVTVHNYATNAQVGGTFEITTAEMALLPGLTNMPGYKDVRGSLSSAAALTASTLYYLRFRKLTGTPGSTWQLVRMDATSLGDNEPATFQGGSDGYYFTLGRVGLSEGSNTDQDLAVQLIAAPDNPTNVVATKLSQTIALDYDPLGPPAGPQCGPAALDYVRITWNSPGTYPSFLQWDIERREPDQVTWTRIGVSAEEGLSSFEDYEAIRNRSVRYRVRARTTDAGFSEWVETADVSIVTEKCEILFTSNARSDLNVGYTYDPEVSYDFPDHDTDELVRLSGVAFQAGFLDAINRGVTGNYELLANFIDQPVDTLGNPIGGEVIFEPIRRIVRSDYDAELLLPYVCVLDYEGNRRFAYVRLNNGRRQEPSHRYLVDALVVPLTDMPTIIRREALTSSALELDGSGDLISTPHVSTLGITGDIEWRWEVEFGTIGFPTIMTVASKWDASNQGSWILQHQDNVNFGTPRIIWTPNGTVGSQIIGSANAAPPWDLSNRLAFKATLDVNDGAGNWDLNFYWALRHGGPYTQLGTTATGVGVTSLFNTTSAPLRIGAHSGTSEPFDGLVYEFDLYNGLAGTDRRVDLNLRNYAAGTPAITDAAGRAYSYIGNAKIVEVAGVA
jgi:hypothetical protein